MEVSSSWGPKAEAIAQPGYFDIYGNFRVDHPHLSNTTFFQRLIWNPILVSTLINLTCIPWETYLVRNISI